MPRVKKSKKVNKDGSKSKGKKPTTKKMQKVLLSSDNIKPFGQPITITKHLKEKELQEIKDIISDIQVALNKAKITEIFQTGDYIISFIKRTWYNEKIKIFKLDNSDDYILYFTKWQGKIVVKSSEKQSFIILSKGDHVIKINDAKALNEVIEAIKENPKLDMEII